MFLFIYNRDGVALISALLILIGITAVSLVTINLTVRDTSISGNALNKKKAYYLAGAGVEHAKFELQTTSFDDALDGADNNPGTTDDNGILSFGPQVELGEGTYGVTVANDDEDQDGESCPGDADDSCWTDNNFRALVTSVGALPNGVSHTIKVVFEKECPAFEKLNGAISSNGPVAALGELRVDGRDHDMNGEYIGNGVFGISSRGVITQSSASDVGGTDQSNSDWSPSSPAEPGVINENAAWPQPEEPGAILGLAGSDLLKTLAQSGAGGSQYVTDPDDLNLPLSGITYIELPSGGVWNAGGFGFSGKGILIVHNNDGSSTLKNTDTGVFRGIIITDDYYEIHNTIIGAVVLLSGSPSGGSSIGQSNGKVLYSKEAAEKATELLCAISVLPQG